VTDNGIVLMGVAALAVFVWSQGSVTLLVVLYAINVFITFSISLAGLAIHWWARRRDDPRWKRRLALSVTGFAVTAGILVVLVYEKFSSGGWVTIVITGMVIAVCVAIRRHYDATRVQLRKTDALFDVKVPWEEGSAAPRLDAAAPTAVLFVGKNRGVGLHTLLWVQRMFPGHFRNFVFLSVGEVDAQSFGGEGALRTLRYTIENSLRYFTRYCHAHGLAAEYYIGFGTEPTEEFMKLADQVYEKYPNAVFFATKLIFARANFLTRWLHNRTPQELQDRIHLKGRQMVLLPMRVD
jgi:hypothetical protein